MSLLKKRSLNFFQDQSPVCICFLKKNSMFVKQSLLLNLLQEETGPIVYSLGFVKEFDGNCAIIIVTADLISSLLI